MSGRRLASLALCCAACAEPAPADSGDLSLTVQPADEREALVTIEGESRHDYSCFSEELSVMICAISGAWRLWPPTPQTTP